MYAENAKQGLFEAENSLEESFVTNKLCLSGFIVEIDNKPYYYYYCSVLLRAIRET